MPFWKTIREASENTGVSESTISRRAAEGSIPSKPHPTDRRKKLVDPTHIAETGGSSMSVNNPSEGGAPPEGGGGEAPPPQQGGFISKIPGGWLTIVIGIVGLILAYLTYKAMTSNQTVTPYGGGGVPTSVTGSGTTPTDTNAGGSPDYTSAIQGLTSAEQDMAQSLQTFYSQFSGSQSDNGSGANSPLSNGNTNNSPVSSIPKSTGSSKSNLQTLLDYLKSIGLGNAQVQHIGTGAQSGYEIMNAPGLNTAQVLSHFGAGWSMARSGNNWLLKGPGATKVHWQGGKIVT